jgi:hypothetical protein
MYFFGKTSLVILKVLLSEMKSCHLLLNQHLLLPKFGFRYDDGIVGIKSIVIAKATNVTGQHQAYNE